MKFIKKHPVLCMLVFIILVLLLVIFFVFKSLLIGGSTYGNRLDGIDKVVIDNDTFSKVCNKFKDEFDVSSCNSRLSGKIVNTTVVLKKSSSEIKDACSDVLDIFSEEQVDYYDYQFFVGIDDGDTYPIIGYKNNDSDSIVWNSNGDE